jgi:hypothetical protein
MTLSQQQKYFLNRPTTTETKDKSQSILVRPIEQTFRQIKQLNESITASSEKIIIQSLLFIHFVIHDKQKYTA